MKYQIINKLNIELKSGAQAVVEAHDNKVFFNAPDGKAFEVAAGNAWSEQHQDYIVLKFEGKGGAVLNSANDAWIINAMVNAAKKNAQLIKVNGYAKIENAGQTFNNESLHDINEQFAYLYN